MSRLAVLGLFLAIAGSLHSQVAPTLTGVSPNVATAGDSAITLTISGTGLRQGMVAAFNGITLGTTFVSSTTLQAVLPAGLLGAAGVAAVTVSQVQGSQRFIIYPRLRSLSPSTVIAGAPGLAMDVTGTGFGGGVQIYMQVGQGWVLLGGGESATIRVDVPASLLTSPGTYVIAAVPFCGETPTQGGGCPFVGPANTATLTVTAAVTPTVTELTPRFALVQSPSLNLEISGSGFAAGVQARWNGAALSTRVNNAGSITAVVPQGFLLTPGVNKVSIVTPSNLQSNNRNFSVIPYGTAVTPGSAPAGNRDLTITIDGLGFDSGTTAGWQVGQEVRRLATTFVRAGQIQAVVPASFLASVGSATVCTIASFPGDESEGPIVTTDCRLPFRITAGGALSVATAGLPDGNLNTPYAFALQAQGGQLPYRWTLTAGNLPSGLTLAANGQISGTPTGQTTASFTVQVTDSSTPPQTASRSLSLTIGGPPSFRVSPSALTFTARRGGENPAPQSVGIFSPTNTRIPIRIAPESTGWLNVSPFTAEAPATAVVSVNIAGLAAGTFRGNITISSGNPPLSRSIPVTLTVEDPGPGRLVPLPSALRESAPRGSAPFDRRIIVTNPGTGSVSFRTEVVFRAGSGWLSAIASASSATTTAPGFVVLTFNTTGLAAGAYEAELRLIRTDTGDAVSVPVFLLVSPQSQTLLVSQAGLELTGVPDGATAPSQVFRVLNGGTGAMAWTAEAVTRSGGNWLRISPAAGSASPAAPSPVSVTADPAGLAPGVYSGTVRITAPGAGNSPQLITVVFNVLSPGQTVPPSVSTGGVFFLLAAGASGAPAADVVLSNPNPSAVRFLTTFVTEDDDTWFQMTPTEGQVEARSSATISVRTQSTGLTPGTRRATLRIGFSDGTIRTVVVTLLVTSPAALALDAASPPLRKAGAPCDNARNLVILVNKPEVGFRAIKSRPTDVEVQLRDCRGDAVDNASLSMRCSDGQCDIPLKSAGRGLWTGTFTPTNTAASLTLSTTAFSIAASGASRTGQVDTRGSVVANDEARAALPLAIVNSASYLKPGIVTPGSWAAVFGDDLADAQQIAASAPFPDQLGATRIELGGEPLPLLFVDKGQVNALIPRTLNPNVPQQLVVIRGERVSVPLELGLVSELPALYSTNQAGTGQGAILLANTATLAGPPGPGSQPAERGGFIQIYATGLGPVSNAPPDGAPAPSTPPLATTLTQPVVTIGGAEAPVLFSGLAPGLVGLYQINVQVPAGAPAGDAVPVVLRLGNATSNTVTIAVR
jgi:uncharacterized protein (TIGR03437 family)